MTNPHSPTTTWLDSVASGGGYNEAEVGEQGSITLTRETGEFEVTVRKADSNHD